MSFSEFIEMIKAFAPILVPILIILALLLFLAFLPVAAVAWAFWKGRKRETVYAEIASHTGWSYSSKVPVNIEPYLDFIDRQMRPQPERSRFSTYNFLSSAIGNIPFTAFEVILVGNIKAGREIFGRELSVMWRRAKLSLLSLGLLRSRRSYASIIADGHTLDSFYAVMFICNDFNMPQFYLARNGLPKNEVRNSTDLYGLSIQNEQAARQIFTPAFIGQLDENDIALVFGNGKMLCVMARKEWNEFPAVNKLTTLVNAASHTGELLQRMTGR